jgi:hypothetical protein
LSFAVSWEDPDGLSPDASVPITATFSDPGIVAGDVIYELTASGLTALGVASSDGTVTVTFESDPIFLISSAPQESSLGTLVAQSTPSPSKSSTIVISSKRIGVGRGAVFVPISVICHVKTCTGTARLVELKVTKLVVVVASGSRTVTKSVTTSAAVTLASAKFRIAVGKSRALELALTRIGKSALEGADRQQLGETIEVTLTNGHRTSKIVVVN